MTNRSDISLKGAAPALGRLSLYASALAFLGFGAWFVAIPRALTDLVSVELPSATSMIEIRGVYGGAFLGIGLLFMLGATRSTWFRFGLVAEALIMGGLVVGRLVGIAADGRPTMFLAVLLASEVVAAGTAIYALCYGAVSLQLPAKGPPGRG